MKRGDRPIGRRIQQGWRYLTHPRVQKGIAAVLTIATFVALGLFLYNNLDTLRRVEWRFSLGPLLLSFAAYSLALGLAILTWGQVMAALGLIVPWTTHIYVYCVTNLAKRIPGILWYVAGRLILYPDNGAIAKWTISVGSALELALMLLSGFIVGLILWPGTATRFVDPVWIAAILAVSLVVVHPRFIGELLRRLGAEQVQLAAERLHYGQILLWLSMYGGVWLAGGIVLFALIQVIYPIPPSLLPWVVGAWSLSGVVSVVSVLLPVGLGIRELTLSLLLSIFLPEGVALVIAILSRLALTAYELIWVLVVSWGKRRVPLILPK